jgi:hypothetical protein
MKEKGKRIKEREEGEGQQDGDQTSISSVSDWSWPSREERLDSSRAGTRETCGVTGTWSSWQPECREQIFWWLLEETKNKW